MQSLTVGYEERKSNMKVYGVALIDADRWGKHILNTYMLRIMLK